MRLILVRHGRTDWNREFRVQGHSDIPLNQTGQDQAEAIAQKLKDETIEALYSSPLSRAYQTAEAIGTFHKVKITSDDRLKELDVGEVDGVYYPRLKDDTPDFFSKWMSDPAGARWPGGESMADLQRRVWDVVMGIKTDHADGTVVITSHLFTILTIMCEILGMKLSEFRRLNLSVASISEAEFNGNQSRLLKFNDICHLERFG